MPLACFVPNGTAESSIQTVCLHVQLIDVVSTDTGTSNQGETAH